MQNGSGNRIPTKWNPNKIPTYTEQLDVLPTSGNNASIALGYTGSDLTTITKVVGGIQYQKTLSYSGSNLINVSSWAII